MFRLRILLGLAMLFLPFSPLFSNVPQQQPAAFRSLSLPLFFEENMGQAPPEVRYLDPGPGLSLAILNSGIRLSAGGDTVQMSFLGGNPSPELRPEGELPGVTNYIRTRDPGKWVIGARHFRQLRIREIYPGIDLVFHGSPDQLEYDFVIAPGADPGRIKVTYTGEAKLHLDQGKLILGLGDTEILHHSPIAYQMEGESRVPVDVTYRTDGDSFGFSVGEFSHSEPLVVDPVVTYSTYWGGSGDEQLDGKVAVDSLGNIILAGITSSSDLSMVAPLQGQLSGTSDVYVTKLDPTGQTILFSTYLGGDAGEDLNGLAIGPDDSIYLAGATSSLDFPLKNATQETYAGGSRDYFVTRLAGQGDRLIYSTYLGGSGDEGICNANIVLDEQGSLVLVGAVLNGDFPLSNPFQSQRRRMTGIIARLDPAGQLSYSSYFGGVDRPGGLQCLTDVALDENGRVIIAGDTEASDLPLQSPLQSENAGSNDYFVSILDTQTNQLIYSTYLGGTGYEEGPKLARRSDGAIWLVGRSTSTDFPVSQDALDSVGGDSEKADLTVTLLKPGTGLIYSSYLGGTDDDGGAATVLAGPNGEGVLLSATWSSDFPQVDPLALAPVPDPEKRSRFGSVTIFGSQGDKILFSTLLPLAEYTGNAALTSSGDLWVSGETRSEDFPTVDAVQPTYAGGGFFGDHVFMRISDLPFASATSDSDSDGIEDSVEDGAPNGGDGNNDGTPDREQALVASLPSNRTADYVTLVGAEGSTLGSVAFVQDTILSDPPPGISFPLGFLSFTVTGFSGDSTTVELLLPAGLTIDTYYRYGGTPDQPVAHWYDFAFDGTTGAEILSDRIVLHFTDGARGDDDLQADGTITDAGGPAQVLSSFVFPQFADGALGSLQFQSTLILANTGAGTSVQVEFHATPDGDPMTLTLGDQGTDSRFEFFLNRGETVSLATPGTGDLQVGYARVFAGDGVNGVVVFTRRDLTAGITLYEAGVPATTELTDFSVVVDSLGVRDTGLALVYLPSDSNAPAANVTLSLYDSHFTPIAEKTLDPLAAGSHLAKFVHELFDDAGVKAQAQEMQGMLVVHSDQPLSAVTLRQNDDPQKAFPQEVPTLTTFPVIAGAP